MAAQPGTENAEPLTDAYTGGAGTPLVLLHGINASWRIWRPVMAALEKRHAVYAPTLTGHRGGPPLAAGPSGIGVVADELETRLDKAGITRAHLVGNSLGGWLALELAARGRAISVVAFSPAGNWTTARDLRRVGMLLRVAKASAGRKAVHRAMANPRYRRALLRSAMERGDLIPAEDLVGSAEDLAACTMLDGLLAALRVSGPVRELKIDVDCPVRIVWPERDRTIPYTRYGVPWTKAVPSAEVVTVKGVGHVPMYDDPELVTRQILEFTDRVDLASRENADPQSSRTEPATHEEKPMTSKDFELTGSQGRLVVRQAAPEAAANLVVVLAHGISEHSGRYAHVIDRLVAEGAVVYAPDHRGHGRSEGPRSVVDDVDAMATDLDLVVTRAREENPGLPLVLLGHSLGGLISIRYAQTHQGLAALALSGPFLGNAGLAPLLEMDPLPDIPIDPAVLSRDPAVGAAYAADPLVYHGPLLKASLAGVFGAVDQVAAGPGLGSLPVLWLHGEGDQLAAYDSASAIATKTFGDNVTAKSYPEAQHEIFNETNKDEVLDDLAAFLKNVRG